jgi:hypothetical protein
MNAVCDKRKFAVITNKNTVRLKMQKNNVCRWIIHLAHVILCLQLFSGEGTMEQVPFFLMGICSL